MDDVSLVDPATEFAGQVAIVTGGVGGIGSAIARRLAAGGARVIAADIAPDTLQRAADIVSAGAEVAAHPCGRPPSNPGTVTWPWGSRACSSCAGPSSR